MVCQWSRPVTIFFCFFRFETYHKIKLESNSMATIFNQFCSPPSKIVNGLWLKYLTFTALLNPITSFYGEVGNGSYKQLILFILFKWKLKIRDIGFRVDVWTFLRYEIRASTFNKAIIPRYPATIFFSLPSVFNFLIF